MVILKYYYLMAKNGLEQLSFAGAFKSAFLTILALSFGAGLYFGFYRLISYLDKLPIIGPVLIYKILAMIFLSTFVMVIFSALIASLNTLYFSRELEFLLSLPVSHIRLFVVKSAEVFVYSSWMVMLIIIPFLAAFARLKGLGIAFYAAAGGVVLPYLMIASYLGIFFAVVLFYSFPSRRLREYVFVFMVMLGSGIYMLFRFLQPERLVNTDMFNEVMQYITYLQAPTAAYLPSWWLAESLRFFAIMNLPGYFSNLLLLVISACAAAAGVIFLSRKIYFTSINNTMNFSSGRADPRWALRIKRGGGGFFAKEIKYFFRSMDQWPQVFLLAALCAVYLFSIYKLPVDTVYIKMLISFMNIGFAGFVLSAVVLRFVFPAISLEGRSFWILKSAPLSIGSVMFAKWAMYAVPVMVMGAALVGLSCYILEQNVFITVSSIASITFIGAVLVSMGMGFGSIFPRFNVANIAKIESSAGGIFFMITALFYVGVVISIKAALFRIYFMDKLMIDAGYYTKTIVAGLSVLMIIHIAAAVFPLVLGRRKLENYEIENFV